MAVIGIDLGTTYSAAAQTVNGKPEIIHLEGEPTLPSVVGLQKSGKIAVGKTAKRNQAKYPQDTIVEVKRKMGEEVDVSLGDKKFKPQEISMMILKKIKELAEAELGEEITGAVISCPAYFKDPARAAIKQAGELAGLKVLRIINEPTAAAYAYGIRGEKQEGADQKEQLYLVYDLGGGTFDVTVIRMNAGSLEVIGTGGDPQLGGANFDDEIVNWILQENIFNDPKYAGYVNTVSGPEMSEGLKRGEALRMRLKSYAEEGKKQLCSSPAGEYRFQIPQVDLYQTQPIVFDAILTMAKFEELIRELMENSVQWVDEALKVPKEKHKYTEEDLTAVLLVGGSTRVPLVRRILEQRFPNTPIYGQERGINPDEIVALGASIVAAEEDPESDVVSEHVLVDVTGHTLSVAVQDEQENRQKLRPIIPKETPIPWAAEYQFQSMGNFTPQVEVEVYQGEGKYPEDQDVAQIGKFFIQIAPIMQPTPLLIGLNLDTNGILVAHATDQLSGQRVECKIKYSDSAQIDPKELERRKAELDAQLNAVINMSANPLDGGAQAQAQAQGQAPPQPSAWGAPNPWSAPPPAMQPLPPAVDVLQLMNPIIRPLYQKAITSFGRVAPDRQGMLMQLVMEIEAAARTGDQQKLMTYYAPLSQLLEGI